MASFRRIAISAPDALRRAASARGDLLAGTFGAGSQAASDSLGLPVILPVINAKRSGAKV